MNVIALTPQASAAAVVGAIKSEVRQLTVSGPDVQALLTAVSVDLAIVPDMDVDSAELADEMREALGRLSTVHAAIEAERLERGKPVREVLAWLNEGYGAPASAIESAIDSGKQKLRAWVRLQNELAHKEQEAARAAAAAAAAQAAAAEAEALAKARADAEEAARLRAAGSEQAANAMETQAMVAADAARQNAAHAVAMAYSRPAGAAKVKAQSQVWKAECISKAALLAHIGALCAKGDGSLIGLVEIAPKAINKLASVHEAALNVPGLRAYAEERATRIAKVAVSA